MPEARHQKKQKILNVAQKIEVENVDKQQTKARWGIPSQIVEKPGAINGYFEIFLRPRERQTRRHEKQTGTEEYKRITSLLRGLKSDVGPTVNTYIHNLIKQRQ